MQILNRQETEDLILDLYHNQKKTFREIQKIVRKSPRDIRTILNKVEPERTSLSESSQAFKMFTEGSTPIQVAIALGLEADQAIHLHQEYYKLLGCTEFTKVYPQIKDNPWPYVNLVKEAQNAGMNDNEVLELLRIANKDLPRVRLDYDRLKEKKNSLEANVQRSERTLQEISDRTSKESKTLEYYRSICNQIKEETENLKTKKARLGTVIDSFQNNNETYPKFRQMIKQDVERTISNPGRLLEFALASIFESARKNPGRLHAMHYGMPTIESIHLGDDQYKQYVYQCKTDYETSKSMLLYEAELLYNRMIEESVNMCSIDDMTNNTESVSLQSSEPLKQLPDVQYDNRHGHEKAPSGQDRDDVQMSTAFAPPEEQHVFMHPENKAMERVTFKELPDVKDDDQFGDEDESTNAFILELDSCTIKALPNNTSSQMNEDDNDADVAR